jgi:hypothetical protein
VEGEYAHIDAALYGAAKASDGIGLENEVGVLDPDALAREANHGMPIAVPPCTHSVFLTSTSGDPHSNARNKQQSVSHQ